MVKHMLFSFFPRSAHSVLLSWLFTLHLSLSPLHLFFTWESQVKHSREREHLEVCLNAWWIWKERGRRRSERLQTCNYLVITLHILPAKSSTFFLSFLSFLNIIFLNSHQIWEMFETLIQSLLKSFSCEWLTLTNKFFLEFVHRKDDLSKTMSRKIKDSNWINRVCVCVCVCVCVTANGKNLHNIIGDQKLS